MKLNRMMKQGFTVAVLLGLAMCESVVFARPGTGIGGRRLRIRPYLDLSATYDSNANIETDLGDQDDDFYGEAQAGVILQLLLGGGNLFCGAALSYREYMEEGNLVDLDLGGAQTLSWSRGDPGGRQLLLNLSYQYAEDYALRLDDENNIEGYSELYRMSEDRSSRTRRGLWGAGARFVSPVSHKTEVSVGYGFGATLYDDGAMFDGANHQGSVSAGWKATPKSAAFLKGQYGIQDSESLSEIAQYARGLLGWKTRVTGKTSFRAAAGVEHHDDGTSKAVTGDNPEQLAFSYELAGIWNPRRWLGFQASGWNAIEPSAIDAENTRRISLLSLVSSLRFGKSLTVSAGGTYRKEDYRRAAPGLPKARDVDSYGANARISFAPPERWYQLYMNVSTEVDDSNIAGEDFWQTRATIGARATY